MAACARSIPGRQRQLDRVPRWETTGGFFPSFQTSPPALRSKANTGRPHDGLLQTGNGRLVALQSGVRCRGAIGTSGLPCRQPHSDSRASWRVEAGCRAGRWHCLAPRQSFHYGADFGRGSRHRLEGRSFVGIAFHRADDQTFEAVYLRPFNFNSLDPARRAHSVQYVSMPEYPWETLRENHPGKYEAALAAPVAGDSWIRLTLTIHPHEVRVFVNDSSQPVLSVARLGKTASGGVGLWVGNNSEGRFRNLVVEP